MTEPAQQRQLATASLDSPQKIANLVINALVIQPATGRSRTEAPPFPVLRRIIDDSTHFGVASMDDHGRFRDRRLLTTLGWNPGDNLTFNLVDHTIVIQRQENTKGVRMSHRGFVRLPARTRRTIHLKPGDRLFLVAIPSHQLLVVHDGPTVNKILAHYYSTAQPNGH